MDGNDFGVSSASISERVLVFILCFLSAERLYETVQIVLVGKYTTLQDSYMSVVKALEHASMRCGRKLELKVRFLRCGFDLNTDSSSQWVDSSYLEPDAELSDPVQYHDAWGAVCSAK